MFADNLLKFKPDHEITWWALKVICGVILISGLIVRFTLVGAIQPLVDVPILLAQVLVIIGGVGYCWHYFVMRSVNSDMSKPTLLVSQLSLYRVIRHPMYFADMICYTGLALLWLNSLSILILLISYFALHRQALIEDRYIATRFATEHQKWRQTTSLVIPFVL